MNDKMQRMQEAFAATRQWVVDAAEQKIGRSLTDAERRGIESIGSLMMLESCEQSFSSQIYTPAQVLADLEFFSKQDSEHDAEAAGPSSAEGNPSRPMKS